MASPAVSGGVSPLREMWRRCALQYCRNPSSFRFSSPACHENTCSRSSQHRVPISRPMKGRDKGRVCQYSSTRMIVSTRIVTESSIELPIVVLPIDNESARYRAPHMDRCLRQTDRTCAPNPGFERPFSVQTSDTARPYDATETGAQRRDNCWERREDLDRATFTTYPQRTFGDLDVDRAGFSLANPQLS